jgi:hypothetical protein
MYSSAVNLESPTETILASSPASTAADFFRRWYKSRALDGVGRVVEGDVAGTEYILVGLDACRSWSGEDSLEAAVVLMPGDEGPDGGYLCLYRSGRTRRPWGGSSLMLMLSGDGILLKAVLETECLPRRHRICGKVRQAKLSRKEPWWLNSSESHAALLLKTECAK